MRQVRNFIGFLLFGCIFWAVIFGCAAIGEQQRQNRINATTTTVEVQLAPYAWCERINGQEVCN